MVWGEKKILSRVKEGKETVMGNQKLCKMCKARKGKE